MPSWSEPRTVAITIGNFATFGAADTPRAITKVFDIEGHKWTLELFHRRHDGGDATVRIRMRHNRNNSRYFSKARLTLRIGNTINWARTYENTFARTTTFDWSSSAGVKLQALVRQCTQRSLSMAFAVSYCSDKPVIHESASLGKNLLQLLRDQEKCDVSFILEDGENLHAHSLVLFTRSSFLYGLIDEENPEPIQLEKVRSDSFYKFLEYLYDCVEVTGTKEELVEHLLTANYLEGLGFKRHNESTLVAEHLSLETCIELFILADTYSSPYLREEAFKMLLSNTKTLRTDETWAQLQDNSALYEEVINAALDDKTVDDSMPMCGIYKALNAKGHLGKVDGTKPTLLEHISKKRKLGNSAAAPIEVIEADL